MQANKPWVLDPVAHYATPFRRAAGAELMELRPTIVRGNASEIIVLAGGESKGQGVDSRDPVERAEDQPSCWPDATKWWLPQPARLTSSPTGSDLPGSPEDRR